MIVTRGRWICCAPCDELPAEGDELKIDQRIQGSPVVDGLFLRIESRIGTPS